MITFTDAAKQKILAFMEANQNKEGQVLRVAIKGRTLTDFNYAFALDDEKAKKADDIVIDSGGFTTLIDEESAKALKGAIVDWVDSPSGAGFKVDNPNPPSPSSEDPKVKKIQEILDNEINPGVASHGGHVELIDVQGSRVYLKLGGGCQGCGMVDVTLRQGIEVRLKEVIPEITEVFDTTDHAGGTNPYYAAAK